MRRILVRLIIVALLIPIAFEVAGVRLTPSLSIMILLFPFLVYRFLRRRIVWRLPDLFFFLYVAWQGLTIFLNSPERFVTFTGQQALLTIAGYLSGRLLILDKEDFMAMVLFWVWVVIFSIPFALYEAIADDPVILRFIAESTPFDTFKENDYDPRLGLYRAQFVFVHPIHYGLLSAMILMPFFTGFKNRLSGGLRITGAVFIGFSCFLSVSSGAFLSIMLQFLIFIWYRVAEYIGPNPWRKVLLSGGAVFVLIELASTKSAFVAISSRLSFNSSTAYYRTLIWEYGSQQVRRTPIFGNGFNYWERPFWMRTDSVDNHWLLMAMVHGLPALVFFVSSLLYAFFMVNRSSSPQEDPETNWLRLAWTLSLIGFCMSASTVAIWGEIQLLFMLLFGGGFWMIGAAARPSGDTSAFQPKQASTEIRYSRFPAGVRQGRTTPDSIDVAKTRSTSRFTRS
jgi:hypothetical protein